MEPRSGLPRLPPSRSALREVTSGQAGWKHACEGVWGPQGWPLSPPAICLSSLLHVVSTILFALWPRFGRDILPLLDGLKRHLFSPLLPSDLGRASLPPLVKARLPLAFGVCGVSVRRAQTDGSCVWRSSVKCCFGGFPSPSFLLCLFIRYFSPKEVPLLPPADVF